MGRKRIELQFLFAAEKVFDEKSDKYAIKHKGQLKDSPRIFSYSYKKSLLDFSDNLSNWLQEKYGKIRYVRDISFQMINDFLEHKSHTCSQATMGAYVSHIKKWERIVEKVYKEQVGWTEKLVVPERLSKEDVSIKRIQQMDPKHFEQIMEKSKESRSVAPLAFEISRRFGARVEGTSTICAKDVFLDGSGRWSQGRVHLKEKGGRDRYVDIRTKEDRDFIKDAIKGKAPEDRLVPIKKESINKQLNRTMTELGLKELYRDTGIHSIRKLWAQETWDICRKSGMSFEQAVSYCNEGLGHAKFRDKKLLSIYVKDMH